MISSMIFEPKQKIKKSYYRCDSHFHIDNIVEMYDDTLEHRVDGTIYVDGSKCVISSVQDDRMNVVETFGIRLISQFKNGGQSANRLERIVDENRNTFVQKVVDTAIGTFYDKKENTSLISNLIIYGPSRFKDDVLTYKKGKLGKYFKTIELITSADENDIEEVFTYLNQIIDPIEVETVSEIQELIDLADSKLEFGNTLINELRGCMIAKLVVDEEMYDEILNQIELNYEPEIIIIRSDKYCAWIQNFGGAIGLRWY